MKKSLSLLIVFVLAAFVAINCSSCAETLAAKKGCPAIYRGGEPGVDRIKTMH